jgi:hypothetical protein
MQKKLLVIFSVLFLAAACTKQASIPNSGNPEAGAQIVEKNNQALNLSEWNSYQSPPKYGFSIKYPQDFGFNTDLRKIGKTSYIPICDEGIKTVIGCVYYTGDLYQGTNFGSAGVEVSIIKGLSAPAECYIFGTAQPQKVLINGVEFVYAEENEGAAGHFSSDKIYRSLKGSDCYQLRARITSANRDNYTPGTVKSFDSQQVWNKIDPIVNSFLFTSESAVGQSYITSITPTRGPKGTKVKIVGNKLSGFEGDLDIFFEREDGRRIMLSDNTGSGNGDAFSIVVTEPCRRGEKVIGRYSGIESLCDFTELTPGVYKVYVEPWGEKSNIVYFTLTP